VICTFGACVGFQEVGILFASSVHRRCNRCGVNGFKKYRWGLRGRRRWKEASVYLTYMYMYCSSSPHGLVPHFVCAI